MLYSAAPSGIDAEVLAGLDDWMAGLDASGMTTVFDNCLALELNKRMVDKWGREVPD